MADTSKDGLLLGGGIRHITATQALIFGNISYACAKEYLIAATYYCQVEVEVKVRDRIVVVISEIGRSGRHF